MRTSIDIQDRLFKQVRRYGLERDMTLKATVEEALRRLVATPDDGRPRRRRKIDLKSAVVHGDGLQPGIDLRNADQIRAILYEGRGG